jgi:Flp pilus assembly protein TadB
MCLLMRLTFVSWQSLLLSKALKFEQEAEDQKNELVVSNLEKRVKEFEDSLEEKDLKVKMLKQTWPKLNFVSWIKLLASVIRIKSLK